MGRGATPGQPGVSSASSARSRSDRPAQGSRPVPGGTSATRGSGTSSKRGQAAGPGTSRQNSTSRSTAAGQGRARNPQSQPERGPSAGAKSNRTPAARSQNPGSGAPRSQSQRDQVRVRRTDDARPRAVEGTSRPAGSSAAQSRQRLLEKAQADRERERRRQERAKKRNAGPIGFQFSRKRIIAISGVFLLITTLFAARLAQVQIVQGSELAAKAKALRTTTEVLPASRGDITDRNGQALAKSVTRYKVYGDQKLLDAWKVKDKNGDVIGEGPAYAAELLAPVINVDEDELAQLLTKSPEREKFNQYVVIAKDVPSETWDAIKELRITGIFKETLSKRVYPSGDTAKNIIGIAGTEKGLSGLEYSLDDLLQGKDGKTTFERSLDGYILPSGEVTTQEAVSGTDITTSLDTDIQWHAEAALDDRIKKVGASAGTVIVQDIKTCEILALADRSTTQDGNTATTGRIGAVQDVFEPGSTAKIITMAAAIETGKATPLSKFTVPYRYTTSNGEVFQDSHMHPTQPMTLTGILSDSSNTGTVQVGELLPKQVRYDYLKKFGFGEKTGIELGGESRGILHPVEDWDGRTQYGVLFGQGVAANALQATNAFAVIANEGQMCQPHLVKGTTDTNGVYTESQKSDTKTVVSKNTADKVLKMMESVVVEGSGKTGAVKGYRVAGKTGTAQAAGADGKLSSFVASFIGVAPVEDPQLVVSVIIRDPQASIYGGEVSAPVFADVMSYSLQRLNIEPSTSKPDLFPSSWEK